MYEARRNAANWLRERVQELRPIHDFGELPGVSITIDPKLPHAISLHYAPDTDLSDSVRWGQFNDALERLEFVLKKNPHILVIYATTWIAHEHPRFFERYGFTVTQPMRTEDGRCVFSDETYESLHATYLARARKFNIRPEHARIPPAIAEYRSENFLAPDAPWRMWVKRGKRPR